MRFCLLTQETLDGPLDLSKVYVYKELDFQNIIRANERLCSYLVLLTHALLDNAGAPGDQLLQELLARPEIREKVDLQALRGQTNT